MRPYTAIHAIFEMQATKCFTDLFPDRRVDEEFLGQEVEPKSAVKDTVSKEVVLKQNEHFTDSLPLDEELPKSIKSKSKSGYSRQMSIQKSTLSKRETSTNVQRKVSSFTLKEL